MIKYKKGDKVVVLNGRDRGREGVIEMVYPKKGTALVPGINMYKKHVKKEMAKDDKGGIYDIPKPILLSRLAVLDPKTGKKTRIGFKIEKGKKIRVATKSGKPLGKAAIKRKSKAKGK